MTTAAMPAMPIQKVMNRQRQQQSVQVLSSMSLGPLSLPPMFLRVRVGANAAEWLCVGKLAG
eukprot:5572838-Prymnesium_polylepis.1